MKTKVPITLTYIAEFPLEKIEGAVVCETFGAASFEKLLHLSMLFLFYLGGDQSRLL